MLQGRPLLAEELLLAERHQAAAARREPIDRVADLAADPVPAAEALVLTARADLLLHLEAAADQAAHLEEDRKTVKIQIT